MVVQAKVARTRREEKHVRAVMISTSQLSANKYNPNEMTETEFSEFVAEVRHLGRLPKPVVVRRDGDGYVIVDGEHAWRAATEVGLEHVPCEIIEADDFEAMRQTYKRNQHGTHDPVRLGRMFQSMIDSRSLSVRALAKEIAVSEGTIRNALVYAEAAELRNSYAPPDSDDESDVGDSLISNLSIREVRAYVSLPGPVRDIWLVAGGSLKVLHAALRPRLKMSSVDEEVYRRSEFEYKDVQVLVDSGLASTIRPGEFVQSTHRAFQLWQYREDYGRHFPRIDDYLRQVAKLGLPADVFQDLPCHATGNGIEGFIPADEWGQTLADCDERADNRAELNAMMVASVRRYFRKNNIDFHDAADPRVGLLLDVVNDAPDFIRDSTLSLSDKYTLATLTADAPDDVVLVAKQATVRRLAYRDAVLSGEADVLQELDEATGAMVKAECRSRDVEGMFQGDLEEEQHDRFYQERDELFEDRRKLVERMVEKATQWHAIRTAKIEGRDGPSVFRERLSQLPEPEFLMLASYMVFDGFCAPSRWVTALGGSVGEPD